MNQHYVSPYSEVCEVMVEPQPSYLMEMATPFHHAVSLQTRSELRFIVFRSVEADNTAVQKQEYVKRYLPKIIDFIIRYIPILINSIRG